MSLFSSISQDTIGRLKGLTVLEFEAGAFKVGEVPLLAGIQATPKDIANWAARGFLKPTQAGPRKDRLFSLRDAVAAAVIGHLSTHNPFPVAAAVAMQVSARAVELIAAGVDFEERWETGSMELLFYTVVSDNKVRGKFVSVDRLIQHFTGKHPIPGIVGLEKRIFPADDIIFGVLVNWTNAKPAVRAK